MSIVEKQPRFAVLGAGHGGLAMAADLSLQGYNVRLYSYSGRNVGAIVKNGGIFVSGVLGDVLVNIDLATTNIRRIVQHSDVLLFNVAAPGHERYLRVCLPHLKEGQVIIFNTGYFAATRFEKNIEKREVILAEAALLPYVSLLLGPGRVHIYGLKKRDSIPFATHISNRTNFILGTIKEAFPQLYPSSSVLETSMENMNFILHPQIYVLNIGDIYENKSLAKTYSQWISKPVAEVIDAFDRERLALGESLGLKLVPAHEQFSKWYGARGNNIYEVLTDSEPHSHATGNPFQLTTKRLRTLIDEDVPFGLVPLQFLGKELNVPMPCTRALIDLISIIDKRDYISEGIKLDPLT